MTYRVAHSRLKRRLLEKQEVLMNRVFGEGLYLSQSKESFISFLIEPPQVMPNELEHSYDNYSTNLAGEGGRKGV